MTQLTPKTCQSAHSRPFANINDPLSKRYFYVHSDLENMNPIVSDWVKNLASPDHQSRKTSKAELDELTRQKIET